jgi:hypothetical protein
MHVLPKGFHRIRHYGLLANGNRAANVTRLRQLLATPPPEADDDQTTDKANTYPCPSCGGRMVIIETFEPGQKPRQQRSRDPPSCQGTLP